MDGSELLDELLYCLEEGFPAPVTEALLRLTEQPWTLHTAFNTWVANQPHPRVSRDTDWFIEAVANVQGEECVICDRCSRITWVDETTEVAGGERVCDDRCVHHYNECGSCSGLYLSLHYVGGGEYCDSCRENVATYCNQCGAWFLDDDDDHPHGCSCEAPHLQFEFPANGNGTVSEDESLLVELPKGTIDDEGIRAIGRLVQRHVNNLDRYNNVDVYQIIESIGPMWQAKAGNFTRRLSSAIYKKHSMKLDPEIISEVGNLARAHSSNTATWTVQFTRDLNRPASAFYHGDSCWWGGYAQSRCCLKQWGALAMRSYVDEDRDPDEPQGRVWVQPLNDELIPTHDALNAHAYVVYNGYGQLTGYVAARIVAHLTGKTYKKITFRADNVYVNGTVGYLVADEARCKTTEEIQLCLDDHDQLDADEINQPAEVAA